MAPWWEEAPLASESQVATLETPAPVADYAKAQKSFLDEAPLVPVHTVVADYEEKSNAALVQRAREHAMAEPFENSDVHGPRPRLNTPDVEKQATEHLKQFPGVNPIEAASVYQRAKHYYRLAASSAGDIEPSGQRKRLGGQTITESRITSSSSNQQGENLEHLQKIAAQVPVEDRPLFLGIMADYSNERHKKAPERTFSEKFLERINRGVAGVPNSLASLPKYFGGDEKAADDWRFMQQIRGIKQGYDPATSDNLIGRGLLAASEMAPPMLIGGLAGAGAGAGVGALVGTAAGETAAGVTGIGFWGGQEAPGLYEEMRNQGINHDTAAKIAIVTAPIIGGIEAVQVGQAAKPFSEAAKGMAKKAFLKKMAVELTKTNVKENLEEDLQNAIGVAAKAYGTYLDKHAKGIDWSEEIANFGQSAFETALAMPFIQGPGAVVGGAKDYRKNLKLLSLESAAADMSAKDKAEARAALERMSEAGEPIGDGLSESQLATKPVPTGSETQTATPTPPVTEGTTNAQQEHSSTPLNANGSSGENGQGSSPSGQGIPSGGQSGGEVSSPTSSKEVPQAPAEVNPYSSIDVRHKIWATEGPEAAANFVNKPKRTVGELPAAKSEDARDSLWKDAQAIASDPNNLPEIKGTIVEQAIDKAARAGLLETREDFDHLLDQLVPHADAPYKEQAKRAAEVLNQMRNPVAEQPAPSTPQASPPADLATPAPALEPHKFSSTQINLPEEIAAKVVAASKEIPDADLAEDGRETEPHVTVKYGLHTNEVKHVRKLIENEPPIKAKLGKTSIFPASETDTQRGGAQYDVVKLDVDSPDLHRINKLISDALPHTDTHPNYHPHVTLAYVKPGLGEKYGGMADLEGQELTVDRIIFSDKDRNHVEVVLKGKPAERSEAEIEAAMLKKMQEKVGLPPTEHPAGPLVIQDLRSGERTVIPEKKTVGKKTLTEKAAAAREEFNASLDEAASVIRKFGLGLNPVLNPEIAGAVAKVGAKAVKAGVLTFADFTNEFAKKLGKESLPKIKAYLQHAWDAAVELDTTGSTKPEDYEAYWKAQEKEYAHVGQTEQAGAEPKSEQPAAVPGMENGPGESGANAAPVSSKPARKRRAGKRTESAGTGTQSNPEQATGSVSGGTAGDVAGNGAAGESDAGKRKLGGRRTAKPAGAEETQPLAEQPISDVKPEPVKVRDLAAENHVIKPDAVLAVRSEKESLANNIAAIKLLKQLEEETRNATPAEKEQLAKFTGWGGLSQAFDAGKGEAMVSGARPWLRDEKWEKKWGQAYRDIKNLLTEEEWISARDTTPNAHYTSRDVIEKMWGIAEHLGFRGGRVLEPGAGIGHFAGLVPASVRGETKFSLVEIDSASSRLLKKLYPEAHTFGMPMEEFRAAPGSLDLVIGNVPFLETRGGPADAQKRYGMELNLHNYFIARSLDAVRPGGLVVAISTHNTLDAAQEQRKLLASKGELLGAIRLPNDAFKENAKTEVVTDILIFRKPIGNERLGQSFTNTEAVGLKNESDEVIEKRVNEYFAAHPEMILGEQAAVGSMYGKDEYTVVPTPGNLAEKLDKAMQNLPANVFGGQQAQGEIVEAGPQQGTKEGLLRIKDGKLQLATGGKWVDVTAEGRIEGYPAHLFGEQGIKRAQGYIGIRDAYSDLRKVMLSSESTDAEIKDGQNKLQQFYDEYVAEHGQLNEGKTRIFQTDPEFYRVLSLEHRRIFRNKDTGAIRYVYEPASVFTKRTLGPREAPASVSTVKDGLWVSLGYRGGVDAEYIAQLTGKSTEDVTRELISEGLAYKDPATQALAIRERYLSGNVREKLRQAEIAAEDDSAYQVNVDALKAVQPERVPIAKVSARLGGNWIPPAVATAFAQRIFNDRYAQAVYGEQGDSWTVAAQKNNAAVESQWGTARVDAREILADALNLRTPKVIDKVPTGEFGENGKEKYTLVLNEKETIAAKAKLNEMQKEFRKLIDTNEHVAAELEDAYNHTFNAYVDPVYNGSHLELPGANIEIELRPYQKNAIWRNLLDRYSLMAHAVGAGKTYTMIATAMEMRRLGLAKRPLLVVQNATLGQFAKSFMEMYPNANVMVADKDDLQESNRHLFLSRITSGDWEAVVMAQSTFDRLANNPETAKQFVNDQLAALEEAIHEEGGREKNPRANSATVKDLVKARKALEKQLDKILETEKKNEGKNLVHFEDLHNDALFLDECFPAETPIVTNIGIRNIGDVVREKLAVKALCRNNDTGLLEWKPITRWLTIQNRKRMVRVNHEYGYFTCTEDHKVWTQRGYIEASLLLSTDKLHVLRESVHQDWSATVPMHDLHGDWSSLPVVRKSILPQAYSQEGRKAKVLLNPMLGILADEPTGIQNGDECPPDTDTWKVFTRKKVAGHCSQDAGQQSNEESTYRGEDASQAEGKNLSVSRREFQNYYSAGNASYRFISANGTPDSYGSGKVAVQEPPQLLQGGRGVGLLEGSHRSGRQLSQNEEVEVLRCQEDGRIECSWVESITVLESGSDGGSSGCDRADNFVYDIEVEGNHNFFAAGVLVSNCHAYKKPFFITKLDNLVGLNKQASARGVSTMMKVRTIQNLNQGKNVFFATGTPITNTLGEAWHMMNFVAPHVNEDFGVKTFDGFVGAFALKDTVREMNAGGQWVPKDALVKFTNGPELIRYLRAGWDILSPDDLRAYMTANESALPELRDGKVQAVTVEQTPGVAKLMDFMKSVYARFKAMPAKDRREYSYIPAVAYGAAKAGSLDIRLVYPEAAEEAESKLNRAVDLLYDEYDRSTDKKGVQLFFSDVFNPRSMETLHNFMAGEHANIEVQDSGPENAKGGEEQPEREAFLFQELKKKLIAKGIPAGEIAIVGEANTDTKRDVLFERANSGDVRVLLGSSAKMGVGVNVQKKLVAMHHFDAPWLPADVEQREGRIIRFGNENKQISIYRYAMKNTLDAAIFTKTIRKAKFIWQALAGKFEGREFDDPASQTTMSIEEQLAAIQGDPLLFLKMDLDRERRDLELERESHQDQIQRNKSAIKDYQAEIKRTENETIPNQREEIEFASQVNGEEPSITYEGTVIDEPKEIDAAIKQIREENEARVLKLTKAKKTMERQPSRFRALDQGSFQSLSTGFTIGPYRGHISTGAYTANVGDGKREWVTESIFTLNRPGSTYNLYEGNATTGMGLWRAVANLPERLENSLRGMQERVATRRKEIADLEAVSDNPWTGQDQLDKVTARLAEIETELFAKGANTEAPATEDTEGEEKGLPASAGQPPAKKKSLGQKNPPATGIVTPSSPSSQAATAPSTPQTLNPVIDTASKLAKGVKQVWDGIRSVTMPMTMTPEAKQTAAAFREMFARKARRLDIALERQKQVRKYFNKQSDDAKANFYDGIEHGDKQPDADTQQAADTFRDILDGRREEARALPNGKAKLREYDENYFPHQWENPDAAKAFLGEWKGNKPLQGSRGWFKKRTVPTIKEGIARGLKLKYSNPVDMVMNKIADMDAYILSQQLLEGELKDAGLVTYVGARGNKPAPEGWIELKDPLFQVYGPPTIEVSEYVDQDIFNGLEEVAADLGVEHVRKANVGKRRLGVSITGRNEIQTQNATAMSVLAHELGHQIDDKFGMQQIFGAGNVKSHFARELTAIADLRYEGEAGENASRKSISYGQTPSEQMADVVAAYVTAPERMKEVAPVVYQKFDRFVKRTPKLKRLAKVKAGLALKRIDYQKAHGGVLKYGSYYAVPGPARVINNLYSKGISERFLLFRWALSASGAMNMFQLGYSAFHASMTAGNAIMGRLTSALQAVSTGNLKTAGRNLLLAPIAPVWDVYQGSKVLREWRNPGQGGGDLGFLTDAIMSGGHRGKIDAEFAHKFTNNMFTLLERGGMINKVLAAVNAPFALTEQVSRPIMEFLVPWAKAGVAAQKMRLKLEQKPNMTHVELREEAGRIVDAIDNQLGQLVYDNLFWPKWFKESLQFMVRSVGWTLGTERLLIGAPVDTLKQVGKIARLQKPELTENMAYAIMLPLLAGALGGALQYVMTGILPEDWKDLFYPRTGGKDSEGRWERVSLPLYFKEFYAYATSPVQTIKHKIHPALATVLEMMGNADYYGTKIYNEDDELVEKVRDLEKYALKQMIPFSFRGQQRLNAEGGSTAEQVLPMIGVTPAPASIIKSKAEWLAGELQHHEPGTRTQAQADRSSKRRELVREYQKHGKEAQPKIMAAVKAGEIEAADAREIIKRAGTNYLENAVKKLGAKDALKVYAAATPAEKARIYWNIQNHIANNQTADLDQKQAWLRELGEPPAEAKGDEARVKDSQAEFIGSQAYALTAPAPKQQVGENGAKYRKRVVDHKHATELAKASLQSLGLKPGDLRKQLIATIRRRGGKSEGKSFNDRLDLLNQYIRKSH